MLPKPESCKTCPMYQTGEGLVPDELVPDSEVFILMQNPGADEEEQGRPAVGKTGQQMDAQFLPLAGLERGKDVSVGNILRCRWRSTNELPPEDVLSDAVRCCTERHLTIHDKTRLVVAQGALAFQTISQGKYRRSDGKPATVSDYRGFILPDKLRGVPVYQTLHIAGLDRQQGKGKKKGGLTPAQRWVAQHVDWPKIKRILNGEIPQALPERIIATEDNTKDWMAWFTTAWQADYVVCDTEYVKDSGYLTVLGLLWKRGGKCQGLQVDWKLAPSWIKTAISKRLKDLVAQVPLVVHNFQADLPRLRDYCGVEWEDYKQVIDTLQMHGVMWSEMPHSLEFLASIYGKHQKMKHLSSVDLLLYNFGDLVDTASVYEGIKAEFKHFPPAQRVYEEQQEKLIPIWWKGPLTHGIKINQEEVRRLIPSRVNTVTSANQLAKCMVGRPINLGSDDQVRDYLYGIRGYPIQYHKDTGNPTVDQDALAVIRQQVCPAWNEQQEPTIETAIRRIEEGADPVIELRIVYGKAQNDLSDYLNRLVRKDGTIVDRVHPSIGMPQKTGRWALTEPPISTMPASLRGVLSPDEGYVWVSWDWSGIENYVLRYLSGSTIYVNAQDKGWDLHTWTTCTILGYDLPPDITAPFSAPCNEAWRKKYEFYSKDDRRRVELGKGARFEMVYGGVGNNAALSAVRFGTTPTKLKQGIQRLLQADVEYYRWRVQQIESVRKTGITQTFMGRPWIHTGMGSSVDREALNHPMQGGVVDIAHTTMILMWEQFRHLGCWFSHGLHDSQYWSFPKESITKELLSEIKAIVTREFNINGAKAHFPADFHIIGDDGKEMIWLS